MSNALSIVRLLILLVFLISHQCSLIAQDQKTQNTISEIKSEVSNFSNSNETINQQKNELGQQQSSRWPIKILVIFVITSVIILIIIILFLSKQNNNTAEINALLKDKNNKLQLAKEKAEKSAITKTELLSTMTHELRTPLYAVTGLTHLLLDDDPKPEQKEHLHSLKISSEYLLNLINNILDLNKLEAKKVEIEKTTFNIRKRLNDVLTPLKKSADDRNNVLRLEFDENIPVNLEGDSVKLEQILINLIGNSLKFTQDGDVVVRVIKTSDRNNEITLHFEIEDNGVGISKKKQKDIFESFSQASLQTYRKFGGTGLGLSIVKNLLQLMESQIQLESELGKGSKFWFDLVFEISNEVNGKEEEPQQLDEAQYSQLENKYILVVEDNRINQIITRKILEKRKIKCQAVDSGMDAIKLLKSHSFDLILMDIHMPGMNGIETTKKIRKSMPKIPIIALTALTIEHDLDEFYRVGFDEIIPKPFKTDEFFQKIHNALIKGGSTE